MEEEEVSPPTLEDVRNAIKALKNNKAAGEDGIESELLKYGGEGVEKAIHELIMEVWKKEEMPSDWRTGIICPIYKKGDKSICGNYRGITLLDAIYKMFSKILATRLEPWIEGILGDYQAGFRKDSPASVERKMNTWNKCPAVGCNTTHKDGLKFF